MPNEHKDNLGRLCDAMLAALAHMVNQEQRYRARRWTAICGRRNLSRALCGRST